MLKFQLLLHQVVFSCWRRLARLLYRFSCARPVAMATTPRVHQQSHQQTAFNREQKHLVLWLLELLGTTPKPGPGRFCIQKGHWSCDDLRSTCWFKISGTWLRTVCRYTSNGKASMTLDFSVLIERSNSLLCGLICWFAELPDSAEMELTNNDRKLPWMEWSNDSNHEPAQDCPWWSTSLNAASAELQMALMPAVSSGAMSTAG